VTDPITDLGEALRLSLQSEGLQRVDPEETTDPHPFLLSRAERALLLLLRPGGEISTTMLTFHLQESSGALVARLKLLREAQLVEMRVAGTEQRPALHWKITAAGRELVEATDEDGRKR